MRNLKGRVERIEQRQGTKGHQITAIVRSIVAPGLRNRVPNTYSYLNGNVSKSSEPGEAQKTFLARVRELNDDRVVRILAEYVEPEKNQ